MTLSFSSAFAFGDEVQSHSEQVGRLGRKAKEAANN